MSLELQILPAADQDIDAIFLLIAQDSQDTALAFLEAVETATTDLLRHPLSGRVLESKHMKITGLRKLTIKGFRNHIIFYRVTEETVVIVRVLYGGQDLPAVLDSELGLGW